MRLTALAFAAGCSAPAASAPWFAQVDGDVRGVGLDDRGGAIAVVQGVGASRFDEHGTVAWTADDVAARGAAVLANGQSVSVGTDGGSGSCGVVTSTLTTFDADGHGTKQTFVNDELSGIVNLGSTFAVIDQDIGSFGEACPRTDQYLANGGLGQAYVAGPPMTWAQPANVRRLGSAEDAICIVTDTGVTRIDDAGALAFSTTLDGTYVTAIAPLPDGNCIASTNLSSTTLTEIGAAGVIRTASPQIGNISAFAASDQRVFALGRDGSTWTIVEVADLDVIATIATLSEEPQAAFVGRAGAIAIAGQLSGGPLEVNGTPTSVSGSGMYVGVIRP